LGDGDIDNKATATTAQTPLPKDASASVPIVNNAVAAEDDYFVLLVNSPFILETSNPAGVANNTPIGITPNTDGTYTFDVTNFALHNDIDPDGDPLTVTSIGGVIVTPAGGMPTPVISTPITSNGQEINAPGAGMVEFGSIHYTTAPDFTGDVVFT